MAGSDRPAGRDDAPDGGRTASVAGAVAARIAPGGGRLAAVPGLLAVPALAVAPAVGLALAALAAAVLLFHRDPERDPPATGVVAPADGTVSVVRTERHGDERRVRVGVYMGPADVHVNRAPAPATVAAVTREPGANRPAFSKESDRNERVHVDCGDYRLTLIAGWFARRIRPYVAAGDRLDRGDRVGHISFGSRADVLLPPAVDPDDVLVATGDRVRAGETVLVDDRGLDAGSDHTAGA